MRPLRRTSKVVMMLFFFFFFLFAGIRISLALKRHKSKSVKPPQIAHCSLASRKSTPKYSDTELMLT